MLALIKKEGTKFGVRAVTALDGLLAAVLLIYLDRHGARLPESEVNLWAVALLLLGVGALLLLQKVPELLVGWSLIWGSLSVGSAVALVLALLALTLNPETSTIPGLVFGAAVFFTLTALNSLAAFWAIRQTITEKEHALGLFLD
jgi:hypothetical protein